MGVQEWKQRLKKQLQESGKLLHRWKRYASEQLVGLELGPGFIKLLKINVAMDPPRVEAFGIVPVPEGALVKEEIKDPAALGRAVQEVLDQAGIKVADLALSIPRSSTIIKTIQVDKRLNNIDIESRAWIEANHHFPDLVGDIYLDFDLIGPSAQDPSQLDLLLVACRKDQIKPYVDLLQQGGLKVKVVDVNCYALERSLGLLNQNSPDLKTVALWNLDYNLSSLIVVNEGQLIYAHDHSYEGFHFFTQIKEFLKDNAVEAALANKAYVDLLRAGISAHLRHSMHFFYSSRPHIAIQKLILSGDCSGIPLLNKFIEQETGIPTELADPLQGMTLSSGVDQAKLQQYSSALMLASGLSLSVIK